MVVLVRTAKSPAIFYAVFLITGAATVLLGVLIPNLHLADDRAGHLLALQFGGQMLGSTFIQRTPSRWLGGGLALSISAAACLAFMAQPNGLLLLAFGIGLGLTMAATNAAAGLDASPAQRAARMQMLNFFWPLGAAACPWLTPILGPIRQPLQLYGLIAALYLVMLAVLVSYPFSNPEAEETAGSVRADRADVALLGCLAFLAVGAETALAAWLPSFAARSFADAPRLFVAVSLFWCGILLGRLCASVLVVRVGTRLLGLLSALAATVALLGLIQSAHRPILYLAAFLSAFLIAPLYPIVLARTVDLRWRNLIFTSAGLGSAAVPWLVGHLSMASGSLRLAMLVSPAATLLIALVLYTQGRKLLVGAN